MPGSRPDRDGASLNPRHPVQSRSGAAAGGSTGRSAGRRTAPSRGRQVAPPVLVRQIRGTVVESVHRGSVVETSVDGVVSLLVGDPEVVVTLRSSVKPFSLACLVEAGGVRAFGLTDAELAVMAGSHSGEDLHVRTIQGVFRRSGLSQAALACGVDGAPLDALTAARLARDGERPGPIRHMCSGQHASFVLLAKLAGWPLDGYWQDEHPVQAACRDVVARAFGTRQDRLVTSVDACGIATYAFPLREVARAYALLADPTAVGNGDARATLAPALTKIRDAMLANPELIAGTHDRLDTSLMKALPGRLVSKTGAEGLRALAIMAGSRQGATAAGPMGMAITIEDGSGFDRAAWAASVEALRQAGLLGGQPLRALSRYHRPVSSDPHGRVVAEAVPAFELAPVGELLG